METKFDGIEARSKIHLW